MIKLKDIVYESKYMGSCVDIDTKPNAPICKIFPDASAMAQKVGNPDENDWGDSKELSETEFYKYIDKSKIPSKSINGTHTFHYIAFDNLGRPMKPSESGLFFIYNEDQDIHYFFGR